MDVIDVIEGLTEGRVIEGEGGKLFPPLAVLGLAGGISLGASSIWSTYQHVKYLNENKRYWNDYQKNTGYSPRYPRRAGSYNDYVGAVLGGASGTLYGASLGISSVYDPYSYKGRNGGFNPYDNGYY